MVSLIIILSLLNLNFQDNKTMKILFFGDSITELGVNEKGYISLMNLRLNETKQAERFHLIGSGIGGNKVYDLFFRMENDVLTKQPDVVVIWIGVNDVWHKSMFGTGTDINKFEAMYTDIIQRLQKAGIKVFCCTPACIGEKKDHSNMQDVDLNEFSKVIRKIAVENNAGLIDFRKTFLEYNLKHNTENKYQGTLTYDGVHLNDSGNQLVADMMWNALIGK